MSAPFGARALFLVLLTLSSGPAFGWSGDTWGTTTRSAIQALADEMIDSTWSPRNTFTNFQYGSTYQTYFSGATYQGVAYSQNNPQENWPQFLAAVTNTTGGNVGYGNDCSGFVSICWRLPARYTTALFESNLGSYWTSLGEIGSAAGVELLPGDALNRASSHIILFLNQESGGIRSMEQTPDNAQRRLWSYSALANYRPIRRLLITDAPVITRDGVSRVVDAGKPLTLSVSATGAAPLAFQWRFNGVHVAGATSSSLTLASAQLTHAGDYVCVVANASGSVTSRVMSVTVYPPQTTVFLDTLDTDTRANWILNQSSSDTRATFEYDYSLMGIPPAPRSADGTTRGLRLEANLTGAGIAALSLSPRNQNFNGDYRLRFDLWINANGPFPEGGTGSTQFLTAGLGTAGNRVQWTVPGSTADGCWFSVDGEGGASDTSSTSGDFCVYLGATLQSPASGCYTAGTETSARGNLHSYYVSAFPAGAAPPALQQAGYPQQTGALSGGTVGFAWHEVIIARRGSVVDWAIDGARLATVTNASFSTNNVFVGYWDAFASLSDNPNLSFGLVDNVRVEVPRPSQPQTARFDQIAVLPTGQVRLQVSGLLGHCALEASTNLVHWVELTNFYTSGGVFQFLQVQTNFTCRFYRMQLLE